MPTLDNTGNLAYIYDEASDTWYALSGTANSTLSYTWENTHTFEQPVTFEDVIKAEAGVNNYATVAARDAALTSPVNGTVAFVQNLNQLQYYSNGWRFVGDDEKLITKTATHTLELADGGKTILVNASIGSIIYVPDNATVAFPVGQVIRVVQIGTGSVNVIKSTPSVNVYSRDNETQLAGRYSKAELTKIDTNSWILSGDLDFELLDSTALDPDFNEIVSAPNYDIDVTTEPNGNSITINFAGGTGLTRKTITANTTFTGQNYRPGVIKTVLVQNGAGAKNLTFPANWTFLGQQPASIAADKVGILSVTSFGNSDLEVVASWVVEV